MEQIELLDWRRGVFEIYRQVRVASEIKAAWERWRAARDALFASHPQSPIPEAGRARFNGLSYYEYNPQARVLADIVEGTPEHRIAGATTDPHSFARFADASFALFGNRLRLPLYWLDAYGGGLFLPFRDATNDSETYGGGRYLLDTVKGADLGTDGDRLVLDFNFSYNPSCAYDDKWACPLALSTSRIPLHIRAGERSSST